MHCLNTRVDVSPLVTGVSGAIHQGFSSETEAEETFSRALDQGRVRVAGSPLESRPSQDHVAASPKKQHQLQETSTTLRADVASRNSMSRASPFLDSPAKKEVTERARSASQYSASPSRGGRTPVALSSGSMLSPLVPETRLPSVFGSSQAAQSISSSPVSGVSRSPSGNSRRTASSLSSVRLSGNENSLPPSVTINVVHHIHHHIHHHSSPQIGVECTRDEEINSLSSEIVALDLSQDNAVPSSSAGPSRRNQSQPISVTQDENINSRLPSEVGAFGLSQDNFVPPLVDPRSPLSQSRPISSSLSLASQTRPSPRVTDENALGLFSK
ncbi:hypothetical protein R3P38DRAFT_1163225 [Favolaschia claudopus]|uniref:Uncharacterized protein n=1 Tax=Favolaschia claudopus TaxID=2862362 RepID=A0AAW0DXH5_9AGAR